MLIATFFILTGLAEAVPRQTILASALGENLAAPLFQVPPPPEPSGTEPPYPLNHTLDGEATLLGAVQNFDFEAEPSGVGSPPTNSDLEAAPVEVLEVPNGDFETGDFTDWTLTGGPTIQSDATHGYWARMGSNGQAITSAVVDIPQTAQSPRRRHVLRVGRSL